MMEARTCLVKSHEWEKETMARLHAGAAQVIITPPVGIDLCGFAARPGPSQGVHDELLAKALYLSTEEGEVLLITADLIGLSADDVRVIRELVHREIGLPPDAVMVTCSHTHAGPATHCIRYLGDWDEAYLDVLTQKVASAAIMAARKAEPAAAGWGREPACIHANRRQKTTNGIRIGVNESGITLPWVDVLAVDTASGRPIARWFSHAAHAVTLGADNLLISADWPGYAQRSIEGACPGAIALFAQGCCGDLNPHPRGSFDIAERHGWVVAGAAIKASSLSERSSDVALQYSSTTVRLPLADLPAPEEAEKAVQAAMARREAEWETAGYQMRKTLDGYVEWAKQRAQMSRRGVRNLAIDFEIHAIRIGDHIIMGLPGEVLAGYARAIQERSTRPVTVLGYTNGNFGYVPTAEAFAEGGYEVQGAVPFYLPSALTPQCEQIILDAAAGLISALSF